MSQPQAAPTSAPTQAVPQSGQVKPEAAPQATQPTPAEIRKMKLKVDGKELELPENEVIARAQKASAAEARWQESASIRKQAEEIMKFARENPREFFKKIGQDPRKFSEEYLMEVLEQEQMSPEQRRAYENEQKLKQYETEKKQREEAEQAAEMAKIEAEHSQNYNQVFMGALNKAGLPKTEWTVARMAQLQLVNLKKGLDLNADQLAKVVRDDYFDAQKSMWQEVDGDKLLELFTPDMLKKIAKAQISKLKSKGGMTRAEGKKEEEAPKFASWREYQKHNRGRG